MNSSYKQSSPAVSRGTLEYKKTIAYRLLRGVSFLAEHLGEDRNKMVRFFLNGEGDATCDDKTLESLFGQLEEAQKARSGAYTKRLESRPNKTRPPRKCYNNSYKEWKQSGNRPCIGWEVIPLATKRSVTNIFLFLPHAVNQDRKTGEYYDTDDFKFVGDGQRLFVPRLSLEDSEAFLNASYKFGQMPFDPLTEWGNLSAYLWGDKFYLIEEYDRDDKDCCKTFKMAGVLCAELEGGQ